MSFNVVVNSADCVDGATIKKRMRYYFDFNFFRREKCDYELSFAFRSTYNGCAVCVLLHLRKLCWLCPGHFQLCTPALA